MRLSVKKDDVGYHPQGHFCKIMLDGKVLKGCFTADEETGEAFCYATNSNGGFIFNKEYTEVETVVKNGKVVIILPLGVTI